MRFVNQGSPGIITQWLCVYSLIGLFNEYMRGAIFSFFFFCPFCPVYLSTPDCFSGCETGALPGYVAQR